ncbi:MAG: ZIP family metal transporter [Patescibacteria group bacterium]
MAISYIIKVLVLSLTAGGATFFGVFLGHKFSRGNKISFGASFAAAIMILISLLELLPEAVKESNFQTALLYALLGAAAIFIANKIIPHIHSVKDIENCDDKCLVKLSYLLTIGLILHDFPEGFAIPSSFGQSTSLGFIVVIASFIHNIPEGYALTVAADRKKGFSFYYRSALFSTLASFGGAVFGLFLLNSFPGLNAVFLAFAAGAMLFICGHELIPMAHKYKIGADLFQGFGLAALIYIILRLIFH